MARPERWVSIDNHILERQRENIGHISDEYTYPEISEGMELQIRIDGILVNDDTNITGVLASLARHISERKEGEWAANVLVRMVPR